MNDGVETEFSGHYGGNGGGEHIWNVPAGEYITQYMIKSGSLVDAIQFYTNKGTKSPYYGGSGGIEHFVTIPKDSRIIGIYGSHSGVINQFGLKVEYLNFKED